MSVEIEVVDDPARACAAMLLGAFSAGGHVVLAGGSTPRAAYRELVDVVHSVGVDVSGATVWFGDERCVAPEDERSNYRMVRESLLDPLGESVPTVRRMTGELGPAAGAEEYEQQLRAAGPPELELLLLGLGPDGHTLSLFPDQETVMERSRLVVGVPQAGLEPFVPRISFSVAAVTLARQVVFLVSGASKARAVAAAFGRAAFGRAGEGDAGEGGPPVPAGVVARAAREVTVLLDPAAAAELS